MERETDLHAMADLGDLGALAAQPPDLRMVANQVQALLSELASQRTVIEDLQESHAYLTRAVATIRAVSQGYREFLNQCGSMPVMDIVKGQIAFVTSLEQQLDEAADQASGR